MKTPLQLLTFGSILIFAACEETPGTDQNTSDEAMDTLQYTLNIEAIEAREPDCTMPECTYVKFQIPTLSEGDSAVAAEINSQMEGEIRELIKSNLPEPMSMGTWDAMADAFIEGYTLFSMEFPDNPAKWYLELDAEESGFADGYFTLRLDVSEFLGGAHPSSYTILRVYSLKNGELTNVKNLVDSEKLKSVAERSFRQYHELDSTALLNDAGFIFPEGQFALPENMGVVKDSLILIYNAYEVASYAEGATEFSIPLSKVKKKELAAK